MLQKLSLVTLLSVATLLVGCNSTNKIRSSKPKNNEVKFWGLLPGPIPMDTTMVRVGVVNSGINRKVPEGMRILGSLFAGEGFDIDQSAGDAILDQMSSSIRETKRFKTVTEFIDHPELTKGPTQTPAQIKAFAEKNNVDLVVDIARVDSDHSKSVLPFENGNFNSDGEPEYDYYANWTSRVKVTIRTYHGKTGALLDEHKYEDSASWEKTSESRSGVWFHPEDKPTWVREAVSAMAVDYVYRFYPTNESIERLYVNWGADSLLLAAEKVKAGEWAAAGEIWLDLSNSINDTTAARGMYNMAVYNEKIGQIGMAIFWAEHAIETRSTPGYVEYLEKIKAREQAVLFEQRLEFDL